VEQAQLPSPATLVVGAVVLAREGKTLAAAVLQEAHT
jgi:hypothetical protein